VGAAEMMKPLGTITNRLPFLKEEISRDLELLMESSLNYADFLDRIVKHILENESPQMLVFYVVMSTLQTFKRKHLKSIFERYQNLTILQPFISSYNLALDEARNTEVFKSAERVAQETSNPWVSFEMHILRFLFASNLSLGSAIEEHALYKLQSLVDSRPDMNCFEPRLTMIKGSRQLLAGKIEDALKLNELAIAQALSLDELYLISDAYLERAYYLKNLDTDEAHEMLDKAKEIRNALGFKAEEDWAYCNIRHSVHNSRGEFELSLQYLQRAIKNRETQMLHTSLRALPLNASYVYSELEDGENALEWAKMAVANPRFMSGESGYMAMALTRLARAFVLLGDIEQAEQYLERSETESLKVGIDRLIAENCIVAGHIERAKGELESALFHFERGLEISEQINHQNRINSCLIGLVRTEIDMLESRESNAFCNTSGPWMRLLQSETSKKNLPGIKGILLLLKAELRLKQGRVDEASILLKDIMSISENPGLGYLGRRVNELQSITKLKTSDRKRE
jgi:tetratricopeptide (TPR) repeat protein